MKQARINFVFIILCLFGALVISRLVNIQIIQGEKYKALSEGFFLQSNITNGERGEIFLKNGESLAINKSFFSVYAEPPKINDPEKTAQILNQILNLPVDFILEKLKKEGTLYSLIKNRISDEAVDGLKKEKLSGIYIKEERGRYFPQETMTSQLIGFVDANSQGQYGLEAYYNNILKEGRDLNLTINYNVQFYAEKLLDAAAQNLKIAKGSILILEPSSGKILALANFPNFNPNSYQEYAQNKKLEIFQNEVTLSLFEPGSIFKPITMAAALEEDKITPDTKYTDTGIVQIGSYPIKNYDDKVYGLQTMTNVLEKSINTGAVFAERQLGNNLFLKYLEKFGFFKRTGVDLSEVYSQNKEFKKGYEINFANAAFGQGIQVTLMQLAKAYSALANGGKLATPHLADNFPLENSEQIISTKTASQITSMLVSVVDNGLVKGAKITGYYIAGKTGTAQVAENGGYSSDKTIQSFVGFFPAFHPQFLILVKLDNPQTKTAGYSALPIFHELADYIIHLYQIPPDYQ